MSQTQLDFERKKEGLARAAAEIRKTWNIMIPRKLEYAHGMTKEETEREHKFLVKQKIFDKAFSVYDNKMRANYAQGLAGRHTVHGKRHYYPLSLEVDHSGCVDCERRK